MSEMDNRKEDFKELSDISKQLSDVLARLSQSLEQVDDNLEDVGEGVEEVTEAGEENAETAQKVAKDWGKVSDRFDKISGGVLKGVGKAFKALSKIVSDSVQNNTQYYQSLTKIVGLNGKIGQFSQTLRSVQSGVVSKQDLADFFGATGNLFRNAQAMQQQAAAARSFIAAYGDASVAAEKFRNVQLLSLEDQKAAISYTQKLAAAVENSASGQIRSIKTQFQETLNNLGSSILYTLKPILEFLSQVANAFMKVSGFAQLTDEATAAAEVQLTGEEQKVADMLNEMEQLQASGFMSSLDEVHDTGMNAFIEATKDPMDAADQTKEAEAVKQDALSATSEKAMQVAESLWQIISAVMELGSVFSDIFAVIGPPLLDLIGWLAKIVAGFLNWLKANNALKPVLAGLIGVVLGLAAAKATLAIASIAATGPAALATAAIVGSAVAIGTGILAGVGLSVGGSSSTGYTEPNVDNQYGGTRNESSRQPINIYLDGKKVNDELANSNSYNEEVRIV